MNQTPVTTGRQLLTRSPSTGLCGTFEEQAASLLLCWQLITGDHDYSVDFIGRITGLHPEFVLALKDLFLGN
jgi:hypothetical protein